MVCVQGQRVRDTVTEALALVTKQDALGNALRTGIQAIGKDLEVVERCLEEIEDGASRNASGTESHC